MKRIPKFEDNLKKIPKQSTVRLRELDTIEREAIANYRGTVPELESAIGLLRIGDHIGWKPLVLIHNKRTLRKYENILNIKVKEMFPEEGPIASRSVAMKVVKTLGNFWKAVSGDVKVEGRKDLD